MWPVRSKADYSEAYALGPEATLSALLLGRVIQLPPGTLVRFKYVGEDDVYVSESFAYDSTGKTVRKVMCGPMDNTPSIRLYVEGVKYSGWWDVTYIKEIISYPSDQ